MVRVQATSSALHEKHPRMLQTFFIQPNSVTEAPGMDQGKTGLLISASTAWTRWQQDHVTKVLLSSDGSNMQVLLTPWAFVTLPQNTVSPPVIIIFVLFCGSTQPPCMLVSPGGQKWQQNHHCPVAIVVMPTECGFVLWPCTSSPFSMAFSMLFSVKWCYRPVLLVICLCWLYTCAVTDLKLLLSATSFPC